MEKSIYRPRARSEGLVIEELADELLVYDLQRDKAHCLNSTASKIWKKCNGSRTPADIARRLAAKPRTIVGEPRELVPSRVSNSPKISEPAFDLCGQQLTEQVVWLALDQLSRNHLLEGRVPLPTAVLRISRRQALMRVGIGAAIALPIVVSITAPTAVQAATCFARGHACGTSSQCCSGLCSAGSCA
jgi:hypothetical protein